MGFPRVFQNDVVFVQMPRHSGICILSEETGIVEQLSPGVAPRGNETCRRDGDRHGDIGETSFNLLQVPCINGLT